MDTFLPILTPVFAPLYHKNKVNLGDISKVVIYISCYFCPKNNIYTGIYREMGTFLPILTPVFAPLCPQNKLYLGDISQIVIYTPNLPLM